MEVEEIEAKRKTEFVFDPEGFFYIYLDKRRKKIVVEHYLNVRREEKVQVTSGRLNKVVVGERADAISHTLADLGLISRTDHALYLGMELMKAEIALKNNLSYEQGEELKID